MRETKHVVQLYQDEPDLVEALARHAGGGLALGDGVIVIGTAPRWEALTARLRAGGVDTHSAVLRGQLRLFGARVVLAGCMSHGVPDRLAFNEAIDGIFAMMRARYPTLRVFGEITDILWSEGRRESALAIERFWNDYLDAQPAQQRISLLCACPLDSLDGRVYAGALQSVCALHSRLEPARDSNAFDNAVSAAVREVLDPQLIGMLHSLSLQQRPGTQMPPGQALVLWLSQHMPRTAEKVLARARERM